MYGGDFILAAVFYFISLLALVAKILDWKDIKHHESRGTVSSLVVAFGIVLFSSSLFWTHYRMDLVELETQQIATVSQEPPLTATGVATLTILPAPIKDPVSDRVRLILAFIAILWYVVVAFWPTRNVEERNLHENS